MPEDVQPKQTSIRSSALWVVSLRIVGIGATFVGMMLATRLLGPAGFGEFTFIKSMIILGGTLGMAGLNESGMRFISESLGLEKPGQALGFLKSIAASVGKYSLISAFLLFAAMAAYQLISNDYEMPWILFGLMAFSVVLLAGQQVAAESLRAYHDLKWASVFSGGQTGGPASNLLFLIGMGAAAFLTNQLSLVWVVAILTVSLLVTFPSSISLLKKIATSQHTSESANDASISQKQSHELNHVGHVLLLNQLLVLVTCHCDIWLGKAFLSGNDLGYYSVAKQCMLLAAMPVQMAMMTILPSIPRYWAQQRKVELEKILRSTATYAAIPSFVALGLLCLFPEQLLNIAFGEDYIGASRTVLILIFGHLILVLCGNPPHILAMTGKQSTVVAVNVLSAAVLVIVGYFAAGRYGAAGLAAASSASLAVQHGVLWWLARKKLELWTHIGRPLLQMPQ